ncbi:hypothetical protein [Spongiibacter tropicus]|uniref:hypothetical protein n=1 Tax=Spongiibacter tropicus TaxID=454602 RepID=UPI0035BE5958
MLITLPNADFSNVGLGKVTRLLHGMPSEGLVGLYLITDGDDGSTLTSLPDYSGRGNDATLRANWLGPKKRSYGYEVDNNNGTCFQTAIPENPAGRQRSYIIAGADTLPGSEESVYNNWMGASANVGMTLPADYSSNAPSLTKNTRGDSGAPYNQLFDNGGDLIGTTVLSFGYDGGYGDPQITAHSIDGVNGTASALCRNGTHRQATNAALSAFYDGVTNRGNFEFGPWAHGSQRSVNPTIAHTYAVAVYDKVLTAEEKASYIAHMEAILAARGIVFP